MEELEIFAMEEDTRVIVTIGELCKLWSEGFSDGASDDLESNVMVRGEVI